MFGKHCDTSTRHLVLALAALVFGIGATPWAILHRSEIAAWLDESEARVGHAVQNVVEDVRQELRPIKRASRDASRDQTQAPGRSRRISLPGESQDLQRMALTSMTA